MQAIHLPVRHTDHLLQPFSMLAQARLLDYAGCTRARWVETVLIQATPPGASDGGIGSRPMGCVQSLTETENLMGMPSDVR
jgi:hypothetical protein